MDEELEREINRYNFEVEDAKRYFGEWDMCDPVVWAILRVVQAQKRQAKQAGRNEGARTDGGHRDMSSQVVV